MIIIFVFILIFDATIVAPNLRNSLNIFVLILGIFAVVILTLAFVSGIILSPIKRGDNEERVKKKK